MRVDFKYKDGRVVSMGRQYADVLKRVGAGDYAVAEPPKPVKQRKAAKPDPEPVEPEAE